MSVPLNTAIWLMKRLSKGATPKEIYKDIERRMDQIDRGHPKIKEAELLEGVALTEPEEDDL